MPNTSPRLKKQFSRNGREDLFSSISNVFMEKKQQNIVINIWHITHITYDQTVKQNWPHWEESFTTDFNKHCNMYLQLL